MALSLPQIACWRVVAASVTCWRWLYYDDCSDKVLTVSDTDQVLLIIDVQNDFCPGGALAVADGDQVVPVINALSERFAHRILTQDWHPAGHSSFASSHQAEPFSEFQASYGAQTLWPDHCVQGSSGADFHPYLNINGAELVIRKGFRPEVDSYSAFYENDKSTPTGLFGYLHERGLQRLVLTGLATDYCVAYTALDAAKAGLQVTVVEDACRAIDLNGSLAAAREQMLAAGVTLAASDSV